MGGVILETGILRESRERRWAMGSYRKNRSKLEKLIKKNPRSEYFLALAVLEARRQYWQRAQLAAESALKANPDSPEAKLLFAQILEAREELKKAAIIYQALCQTHIHFSKGYREYARYLMTHTDAITLAQNLLLHSLELDPKDAISHTLIAEIYLLRGKSKQALLHVELAQHYHKEDPLYHHRKAKLYMEMQKYEEAVRQLKIALRMDPKNKWIRNQLHQVLKAANLPWVYMLWKRWVI